MVCILRALVPSLFTPNFCTGRILIIEGIEKAERGIMPVSILKFECLIFLNKMLSGVE